jgi:hypothetical protein
MTTAVKAPDEVEELVKVLPTHLRENFEKADLQLREFYGMSPGVTALVRLWLACGTSSQVRREFELAVLDIKKCGLNPNENGGFDEDRL